MQMTKSDQNYPAREELKKLQLLSADSCKRCKIVLKKYNLMKWNYSSHRLEKYMNLEGFL